MQLTSSVRPRLAALAALLLVTAGAVSAREASAATPLTVAQAIATQNGTSQTVVGYVVGEPVATTTVNTSAFSADYALALADTAGEASTSKMLYLQLTSEWRAAFGLKSNPSLMGQQLTVTGTLTAYFSHAGLKSPSNMALSAAPTPTPTPTPTSGDYYAPAAGKTGAALESSLHQIISVQRKLSYDQVWDLSLIHI